MYSVPTNEQFWKYKLNIIHFVTIKLLRSVFCRLISPLLLPTQKTLKDDLSDTKSY